MLLNNIININSLLCSMSHILNDIENPLTLSYQHCSTLVTYNISIYGHKLYEYIVHHNM